MLSWIIVAYGPCDNDRKSLRKKTTVVGLEWCRKNEFIKIIRRLAAAAAARQSLHYVIITHDWLFTGSWWLQNHITMNSSKSTSRQLGKLVDQLLECRPLLRSTNRSATDSIKPSHMGPQIYTFSLPEQLRQLDITFRTIQTIVENVYVWLVGPRRPVSEC